MMLPYIIRSQPLKERTMMVIQHTDFTIHGSKTVVLGFGRIWNDDMPEYFIRLGAKVRLVHEVRNILPELRKWA